MFDMVTEWMKCGNRRRRAVISLHSGNDDVAKVQAAASYYESVTTEGMGTAARIDRAVHMFNNWGAHARHQYDRE